MGDVSQIVKELKLHGVLRYFVSGSLFVYACHRGGGLPIGWPPEPTVIWGAAAVALVAGIIIYVLHRALAYPIPSRITQLCILGWPSGEKWYRVLWPYTVLSREMTKDNARWMRRMDGGNARQPELNEWGGQIHALYCSGHALLLGNVLTVGWTSHFDPVLAWGIAVLYVGAFAANLRLMRYDVTLDSE